MRRIISVHQNALIGLGIENSADVCLWHFLPNNVELSCETHYLYLPKALPDGARLVLRNVDINNLTSDDFMITTLAETDLVF